MSTAVEWRPWPRDPRYLVGSDGTVLGLSGLPIGSRRKDGYIAIGCRNGAVRTCVLGHVVVCETFHGPRPEGMEAAHRNGDRSDNRASNVRWISRPDNQADRIGHGTNGIKLTVDDVHAIRAALAAGASRNELAARYGVTPGTISHVRVGHSWRRLPARQGE